MSPNMSRADDAYVLPLLVVLPGTPRGELELPAGDASGGKPMLGGM